MNFGMGYQDEKWQTYLMFPNGQSANGNGKHLILYEIIMKGNNNNEREKT